VGFQIIDGVQRYKWGPQVIVDAFGYTWRPRLQVQELQISSLFAPSLPPFSILLTFIIALPPLDPHTQPVGQRLCTISVLDTYTPDHHPQFPPALMLRPLSHPPC
jgi:hypothetical protein